MAGPRRILAEVVRIEGISSHPNADRLDLVSFDSSEGPVTVVTGQHYAEETLAVWFKPGCCIPGYLAQDMWLSKQDDWFEVSTVEMRGVPSPGLLGARVWQKTRDHEFEKWPYFKNDWKVGDDVSTYFGVIPA